MNLRILAAFLLFAISCSVFAVLPENGLYWDQNQPGKGFYVEVQNGVGVVVMYAGDPNTDKPTYYIAAGNIVEAGQSLEPPRDSGGYYPVHGFFSDLYEVSQTPCLICLSVGKSDVETVVGSVEVDFSDRNAAEVFITWTAVLPPNTPNTLFYGLQREDFAYPAAVDLKGNSWYYDLRGEWIFTDETDPMRAPWRFQFSQVTAGTDTSYQNQPAPAWDYIDPVRHATMHCIASLGCSVTMNGEVLFSMRGTDIGLDTMLGYLGPFQYPLSGVYRGTQAVIGTRVPPQPAQIAMPPTSASEGLRLQ